MKTTQDIIYDYIQTECLNGNFQDGFETKTVAEKLNLQRTNVSACLNRLVALGKLTKTATRPVMYRLSASENKKQEDVFEMLVGSKTINSSAVQMAKAAMLYPVKPMNVVLVTSERGCGTSRFVRTMFEFAQSYHVLDENAELVKVNCENYRDLEQLENELFDEENGSFLKAENGMLFLDHLIDLNADTINRLAKYMDDGYLKLGRHVVSHVILVFAIDTLSEVRLSKSIMNKVGMLIHLRSFNAYSIRDRFEMICNFFERESVDVTKQIDVSADVIRSLLLSEYPENLKQLRAMIKRACAASYVKSYQNDGNMKVYISDFSNQVVRVDASYNSYKYEIDSLLDGRDFIEFHGNKNVRGHKDNEIYSDLREKYTELNSQGLDANNIEVILTNYIQKLMDNSSVNEQIEKISIESLSKIVDPKIIETVRTFLDGCQKRFMKRYTTNQFYGLCLHINSLLHKKRERQHIGNEQINKLITDYPSEYAASYEFAESVLKTEFNLVLSVDEIMLITMFLVDTEHEEKVAHPVLLFIMHGESTATSIKNVVNSLALSSNVYSYDMPLDKEPVKALDEIKKICININQGEGIIVLYDMGSIQTIMEKIAGEVDFPIRLIYYPITLFGIELARKCSVNTDIDYVYHTGLKQIAELKDSYEKKVKVIITLCESGKGGAATLKEYIDQHSRLGFRTVALAVSDTYELKQKVEELRQQYDIHAFVGTYNPNLAGIPFIGMSDLIQAGTDNVDRVLQFQPVSESSLSYDLIYESLASYLSNVSIMRIRKVLPSIVNNLSEHFELNYDQKYGLLVHIACMIDRILGGETVKETKDKELLFREHEEAHKYIMHYVQNIERSFNILVNDDEVAILLMMCCKL